ncbi:translocation/assembly module TamB domain-containing protein [Kamptonema animale CS-326]|uniref:translocation/assembly module TamB domain-containing protein n=1 Tax=Kamptonema animale TaxID=92934 RepID=UPI00232B0AC6|nr:translocation/assembly module TamB [Kamptonema animale]MDB9515105.1 translocation/assembly module TamB domain-containing protein [Kamptonema animale CS-326]
MSDIRVTPSAGGEITGKGQVDIALGEGNLRSGLVLDLAAKDLPADAIAEIYQVSLPPEVAIGNISAKAQIFGPLDNIQGRVQWQAPQATYPATGEIRIARSAIGLQNVALSIAGGTVNVSGVLNNGRWQALVGGDRVDLNRLRQEIPSLSIPPDLEGLVSGRVLAAGTLDNLNLNAIAARGIGTLTTAGGTIDGRGVLDKGQWQGIAESETIAIASLADLGLPILNAVNPEATNLKAQLQNLQTLDGRVSGQIRVAGPVENVNLNAIAADARGRITVAGGTVNASGKLESGRWLGVADANAIAVNPIINAGLPFIDGTDPQANNLRAQLQNLQTLNGRITGQIRAAGPLNNLTLNAIAADGNGRIAVAGGTLNLRGELGGGRWQGVAGADAIALNPIINAGLPFVNSNLKAQLQNLQSLNGRLTGQLQAAGPLENLTANAITAFANGRIVTNQLGEILAQGKLEKSSWQAFLQTNDLPLNRLEQPLKQAGLLTADLPPEIDGVLDGRVRLSGNLNNLSGNAIVANGEGQLRLNDGGGIVNARGELTRGNWRANIGGDRIALSRFQEVWLAQTSRLRAQGLISQAQNLPLLGGLFNGQINLSAPLAVVPQAIRAAGRFQVSELPFLNQPFAAVFNWDGKRVEVENAVSPGLSANGFFGVEFEGKGLPSISNLDFNVKLSNFDLESLPIPTPAALENVSSPTLVAGRADFVGRVSGTLADLNLVGDLRLRDLAVNKVEFEPVMVGTVNGGLGRGLDLNLAGQQDRIQIALDRTYLPTSFLIRRGDAIASGRTQGDILRVNLEQFPLATLNLTPAKDRGLGPITGLASGQINIPGWKMPLNVANLQASGQIAIAQPAIGYIRADNFQGQFNYANGVASLINGELRLRQSQYLISGTVKTGDNPEFAGKINAKQGNLQDILVALQYFNLNDIARGLKPPVYGTAADVQTVAVGMPDAPLIEQLRRFAEIQALLQQQREAQASSKIPPLSSLQGNFGGEISVAGSLRTGVQAQFNLAGNDWRWGNYVAEQFSVEGSFQDGTLTVLPLRIKSGETLIGFSGQIGQKGQSGQLRVRNVPVEELAKIVELPYVDVTGNLNLRATIAGTLDNPQAIGELSLVNGTINTEPIENAEGSFSYTNARLNFSGSALVTAAEPITVQGSLPFELPFAGVKADSDQIALNVNLKNEGLAIINVLTPQIAWVDGKGQVQLKVGGTLQSPAAEGIATFENATVRARAFPDPLTGLTGIVRFEGDRIRVEGLQGQLSQGKVTAVGTIPLVIPLSEGDRDRANPLTVALDKLSLNLKGLYRGGANGQIIVAGTALRPSLGGNIDLSNGQVFLPGSGSGTTLVSTTGGRSQSFEVGLDNLRLNLRKGVQVTSPPILSFLATGGLTVNGTLDDLRPQGTIKLTAGAVNLFTTQFRLDRGYPQTATFIPSQGLDPTLDVRLVTSVPEVTRFVTPTSALSSEIADNPTGINSGSVRSIRIQALAQGRASQLAENIELRSSPTRSETELVALLGGSFVQTLGAGDSTLAIANLAGAGLFSNLQSAVTNATGLTEFRLFPTRIRNEEGKSSSSSTLGLGLEVGLDITRNVSASVIRVLAPNQPTEFTVRYRLSDEVLLRGSTNFQGDNRATVEYEVRF